LSSSSGMSTLTIVNGPIKQQLGINFLQSHHLPGLVSNGSMGRFYSMWKRNVLGMRLENQTDMPTHGQNFHPLIGEDDEKCKEYGWKTLAEERGFQFGDNVVSTAVIQGSLKAEGIIGDTAEVAIDHIRGYLVETVPGGGVYGITSAVASVFGRDGWDKDKIKEYLYNNAKRTARYMETGFMGSMYGARPYDTWGEGHYCEEVKAGNLPKEFCESEDLDRLIPCMTSPADMDFILFGDPGRNRITRYPGSIRFSMKIELPKNWDELYAASQLKKDLEKSGAWVAGVRVL